MTTPNPHTTPDGLIVFEQPRVGLCVSAAEHNFMLARWERDLFALRYRAERKEDKTMRKRTKTHVRLFCGGVDIVCDGEMIAGITEREAVKLYESLKR